MPITDSRNKGGSLSLGGEMFADQATGVKLVPATGTVGDRLEVLSGDVDLPDEETAWELQITAVQDFDDPAGFVAFCLDSEGTVVPYIWKPNATGVSYAGNVKIRPVEVGGDVAVRLTTPAVFPCNEKPSATYPVV